MPQKMADSRSISSTFAEKRLYLVSKAVQCLSDSVSVQAINSAISVVQSNTLESKNVHEHVTSSQADTSVNRAVRFDVHSAPPITVNTFADNPAHVSIASKIKSLFITPAGNNQDVKQG